MKVKNPLQDNWETRRNKKQADCSHLESEIFRSDAKHWVKLCTFCKFVLDNEKLHEEIKTQEIFID